MSRSRRLFVIITTPVVTAITALLTYVIILGGQPSYLTATLEVNQPISHVLISPNQKLIIATAAKTQSAVPSLLFWNFQDLKLTRRIALEQEISSIGISPDSKTIAIIDEEDALTIYDIDRGGQITEQETVQVCKTKVYNNYYISRMAFNPHASDIAIICSDGTIVIYNYLTSGISRITPDTQVFGLAYSKDKPLLGLLEVSNRVTLLDTVSNTPMQTIPLKEPSLVGRIIAFCPQGTIIATQSTDSLQELSINDQRFIAKEEFETYVEARAVNQDCSQVATTFFEILPNSSLIKNNNIQVTFRNDQEHKSIILQGHQDRVRSVAFGYDRRTILSGSEDGTIRLWNIEREAK